MQETKSGRFSGETSSSREALLLDPEHYNFDESITRKKSRKWLKPVFIHALIFASYTLAFMALTKNIKGQNCHPNMIFCKHPGPSI
jgi:hypothetical protein